MRESVYLKRKVDFKMEGFDHHKHSKQRLVGSLTSRSYRNYYFFFANWLKGTIQSYFRHELVMKAAQFIEEGKGNDIGTVRCDMTYRSYSCVIGMGSQLLRNSLLHQILPCQWPNLLVWPPSVEPSLVLIPAINSLPVWPCRELSSYELNGVMLKNDFCFCLMYFSCPN